MTVFLTTSTYYRYKKAPDNRGLDFLHGGEGGIRTLEALRLTHFPGVLLRPLGHLTVVLVTALFRL